MRTFNLILSFFIVFLFMPCNASSDSIVLVADKWCPVNCTPNTNQPGFMVEIAQQIFEKAGHTVEYQIVPWNRAVIQTRKGKYSALISASVEDAPDFIFPENEQGFIRFIFYTRKDKSWTYHGIPSLNGIKLGVIQGYMYHDEIDKYINDNRTSPKVQVLYGDSALELNIKKLLAGRIDAILESEFVFQYKANQTGVREKIKPAGSIEEPTKSYIAFSPKNPKSKEYAKILSDGMDRIRKSGKLQEILDKYGLSDWQ